jgi:hypothetical protein
MFHHWIPSLNIHNWLTVSGNTHQILLLLGEAIQLGR